MPASRQFMIMTGRASVKCWTLRRKYSIITGKSRNVWEAQQYGQNRYRSEILVIGGGRPKICIPVMGSTTETLKEAAGHAMKKHPDLIEWRADYFADIENEEVRRQAFDELREILGESTVAVYDPYKKRRRRG